MTSHATICMHEWLSAGGKYFGIMNRTCWCSPSSFSYNQDYHVPAKQLYPFLLCEYRLTEICENFYTPHKFHHMQYMHTQCTRSVCDGSIPSVCQETLPQVPYVPFHIVGYFHGVLILWQLNFLPTKFSTLTAALYARFKIWNGDICYGAYLLLAPHWLDSALDPQDPLSQAVPRVVSHKTQHWSAPSFLVETRICTLCPKFKVHMNAATTYIWSH